jgi:hypothetical protein
MYPSTPPLRPAAVGVPEGGVPLPTALLVESFLLLGGVADFAPQDAAIALNNRQCIGSGAGGHGLYLRRRYGRRSGVALCSLPSRAILFIYSRMGALPGTDGSESGPEPVARGVRRTLHAVSGLPSVRASAVSGRGTALSARYLRDVSSGGKGRVPIVGFVSDFTLLNVARQDIGLLSGGLKD